MLKGKHIFVVRTVNKVLHQERRERERVREVVSTHEQILVLVTPLCGP